MPEPLRDVAQLERSIRNFDSWLGGVVSGGCDVDFLCERRGNFLFVEGKPWQSGVVLGFGQHKTLLGLSLQPHTTVLLVGEGSRGDFYLFEYGTRMPDVRRRRGKLTAYLWPKLFTKTDLAGLRAYVADWWSNVP